MYVCMYVCMYCIAMIPGNELKDVLETAKTFLKKKDATMLSYLPKSLGEDIE